MCKPPVISVLVCLLLAGMATGQQATVRPARHISFPSDTDSNSPALWLNGELVLFNSTGLGPVRSAGSDQFHLSESGSATLNRSTHRPFWIEATWVDDTGVVFAWYHHEPPGLCGSIHLTAPQIGALVSYDGGNSFSDLGIVLENGDPIDCAAQNGYFAGGNGDFTVLLGRNKAYFYFLFSNYGGMVESQGIAIARMPVDRRYTPVGAVEKYYNGAWGEPGIRGQVSPIFPTTVAWQLPDTDAFWGPSVHWNSYLKKFVMLMNHSCCGPAWPQEGIYVSFNDALANPGGWTAPVKIFDGGGWYPQVMGNGPAGTDKLAGHAPRFYMGGSSDWEIVFDK